MAGRGIRSLAGLAVLISLGSLTPSARAQDGGTDPSARDRQSAAQAYDRGTAAYLAEDFEPAARWFETANRMAPAAAALVQAVRSHARAGNVSRAATLALELADRYPDDRAATRTAAEALRSAGQLVRLDVDCGGDCTLEVDGTIVGFTSFFVEADRDHRVVASFETGSREETIRGAAGETRALSFEAPIAEVVATITPPDDDPLTTPEPAPAAGDSGGPVPLAVSIVALVVTAGVGGVLVWSGVDTLDGVPQYEATPTPELLADGQSREERTNWLIGGTALAGAATLVLMILTDWDGDDTPPAAEALIDIQDQGATLGLRGRF